VIVLVGKTFHLDPSEIRIFKVVSVVAIIDRHVNAPDRLGAEKICKD